MYFIVRMLWQRGGYVTGMLWSGFYGGLPINDIKGLYSRPPVFRDMAMNAGGVWYTLVPGTPNFVKTGDGIQISPCNPGKIFHRPLVWGNVFGTTWGPQKQLVGSGTALLYISHLYFRHFKSPSYISERSGTYIRTTRHVIRRFLVVLCCSKYSVCDIVLCDRGCCYIYIPCTVVRVGVLWNACYFCPQEISRGSTRPRLFSETGWVPRNACYCVRERMFQGALQ